MANVSAANKAKAIKRIQKGIVPVSEANPHVKVLVYGRNGKGKTRIAVSRGTGKAAQKKSTLVLDVNEKGTRSVRSYPNAFVYQVKSWDELTYAYWYLKE